MILGGLQKFSLADYPGKTCAILFTRGCNFRCPYCHNPELVWPERYAPEIVLADALAFLETRRGLLDAVTITGGEPTVHLDLPVLIQTLKEMGFLVKLDTNGSNPKMLGELLDRGLLDYVAMDIKAPLEGYSRVSGVDVPVENIKASIQLLMRGGVDYEFRTTVDRELLDEEDLLKIGEEIRGAKRFYLQKLNRFNPKEMMQGGAAGDEAWLRQVANRLSSLVAHCGVR
jgi:pyruvate formate lyase activating enzyme